MKSRYLLLTAAFIALSGAAIALEGGVRTPPAKVIPVPTADVERSPAGRGSLEGMGQEALGCARGDAACVA